MNRRFSTLLRTGALVLGLATLTGVTRAQITVSITGNPSTTANVPMGSSNYHVGEHIYLASEIGTNMTIHRINFNMTSGAPFSYTNIALYLRTTAVATLATGAYNTAGYTLVYNGTMAWSATGFAGVDLTTPFAYTTAAGNLQLMLIRTNNVSGAGPIFAAATGNTGGAGLPTSRRYNSTIAPVNGVTSLTASSFRTAVQFIQLPPCTDPPTAGTTTASANPVCLGNTTLLSLTGGTSGIGQTYLWREDGLPAPGLNTGATYTATINAPHSYTCDVTCGANTATSSSLGITINTTTFPEDFSSAAYPPNCFSRSNATYMLRSTANGFAAPGTGSGQWNFFNAPNATVLTLTSPPFAAFGTPKQLNFDVAGATYTGGEVDQIFLEASSDGGTTWPTLLATLNNNPTNGLLNPTNLATTLNYVPTLASEWATRSFIFPAGTNRLRWRGVSNFGNNVYLDNLTITDPPACLTPTSVAVSNITAVGADVSWACAGCTGQYWIEYGAPGFVPGTTNVAGGGTMAGPFAGTSGSISGLTGTTGYDVHVRQDCGSGIYSANSAVVSFLSACSGASCAYSFHLTDNFGDSWNGATIDVRMNGFTVTTLGLTDPCESTVSVNLCAGATITLVCTNIGAFPDEPGLTMTNPFGSVLYQTRGTSIYTTATSGNACVDATSYPTPGSNSDLALGTLFTIVGDCTPPPCTDPPVAGTISAGSAALCSGTGTTLTMSNGDATGLTRQWQESTTGLIGSWSSIGGANAQTYATGNLIASNYYRFYLDCGAGSDTSAAFLVNVSLAACYCVPVHGVGCGNGNITNVTLNTLNNTTVCNPPGYEAFAPTGAATTSVQQAVSYSLNVTTDQSCIISVWVDWDHNNVYDTYEWTQVALSSTANVASVVSLQVPLTAILGPTAMRIRSRFATNPNGPTNACGPFGSGESEDYVINVDPAPPCIPASAITFTNVNNDGFDVNWTNGVNSCGLAVYNIEYGPTGFVQGTGTTVGPVANGPVTISGLDPLTRYDVYVTRDCTPCGDGLGTSALGSVTTYPDCALAQVINCPSGVGLFGPNGPGAWNFVEPLFNFTTVGTEQIFSLSASVLGSYSMSLTANAGNSIVAIYIKDQALGCGPDNWTYVGTNQFTVQSFNFPIAATGNYYVLVDPVSSSLDISTYIVTFVCPVQNVDCATAEPLVCGTTVQSTTAGLANTLPVSGCTFFNASTGGSVWYSYTGATDQEVTVSTCGTAQFDTRISVYRAAPDCSNLQCVALNDDGTGCPDFSSLVSFPATGGELYYVVVHGFGADEGFFQMSTFCTAPCSPAIANDLCSSATALTPALDDGNGVATPGDNTCAYGDANTGCDLFGAMQGLWYSFNSGDNSIMFLDINLGTATTMNYALYDGGCAGLGALNEIACEIDADGTGNLLPALTPNTDYLLYLWNDGGVSSEGDFTVLLRRPGMNDAAVDAITGPVGEICSTLLSPVVVLRNAGELPLTSVTFTYDVDGGPSQTYAWTGNLAYQETEVVNLDPITSPSAGTHDLNVATTLPNGVTDDLPANDAATTEVNITGESVTVVINTDNNGNQLEWLITDAFGSTVATGGPYPGQNNVAIPTTVCLPTTIGSCYSFFLTDSGGDGLCCLNGNGSWELRNSANRLMLRDLFNSTPDGSESPSTPPATPSYGGHEFCLPGGPSNILASECGIFNNTLQNKVYTASVPGVLNYQFEFSDPDAGFRRRILVPRNWVKFAEMVSNPLTPGTVYFARARADVGQDGIINDTFGAGCEMAIDPVAVPGCTGLITTPGQTFSCGVTKAFGGSDKIWAQPVVGATQYRFRFSNVGEGYLRAILRPSYVCLLSWVTNPLVNGSTYSVTVEILVNGQWSGYCGPACSVTILNPPANVEGGRMPEAVQFGTTLLFPNPVNDGLVNMQLAGLTNSEHRISVEMFDVFGKRVKAEQFNASGETFSTVLELDATMATGIYLVNITVDGVTTTKRLSVL